MIHIETIPFTFDLEVLMKTTLSRRKIKKLAKQMPQPQGKGLWALLLCGLAIFVGIKMFPELRRYWRIKRM